MSKKKRRNTKRKKEKVEVTVPALHLNAKRADTGDSFLLVSIETVEY